MRHWKQAQARVLEANLETHTSRGSRGSGSSTSYRATVRYQYVYEDKRYTGTRAGIESSSDNIGSYQQDMASRLQQAQHTEEQIPCYVNPDHPSDAVLDRSLRIGLLALKGLFGAVFGVVGGLAGGVGLRELRRRRVARTAENLRGEEEPGTG